MAFAFSFALFIFWGLLGYSVLTLLQKERNLVQKMLLAPVVGLSITIITVFWLNRFGYAVADFGGGLTLFLLLSSIFILWRFRPVFPFHHYVSFFIIFVFALFLTGRPLLEFGFNWLSYSNDDFANYAHGAARILNNGFFDIPNLDLIVKGLDYSLTYWFFNLVVRPAAEMLTAWCSSLSGTMTDKSFMPLIMALHLTLISSTGAMVCQSQRYRFAALLTCLLLSVSALMSLGALYQLIGQVGGLAVLIGTITALFRPFSYKHLKELLPLAGLIAILVSALFIIYPEVVPFLIIGYFLYCLLALVKHTTRFMAILSPLFLVAPLMLFILNSYLPIMIIFLINQATAGLRTNNIESMLFPYYLIPSGLATFWGFQSVVKLSPEPVLSVSIFLGGALLVFSFVLSIKKARLLLPSAIMTFFMLLLGINLFFQRSDFGLFKLAMFIQPFILSTVVIGCFKGRRLSRRMAAIIVMLAIPNVLVQFSYVQRSRGELQGVGSGLVEVPGASLSRINDEFLELLKSIKPKAIISDTSNIVLAKFQALYSRGIITSFPTQDMFYNIAQANPGLQLLDSNISVASRAIKEARQKRFHDSSFIFHTDNFSVSDKFTIEKMQPPEIDSDGLYLIAATPKQNLLNRTALRSFYNLNFIAKPWSKVCNHLIFISSQLGLPYYTSKRQSISISQLEPDLYLPGKTMAGLGRYFLFQVINPTKNAKMVLEMTTTLKGDGENKLPPAAAYGNGKYPFPLVGRGSARVYSPTLSFQYINERPYFGLDMGVDGQLFPTHRTGLMKLYGTDIMIDTRRLVGFGRNISLVSDDDYQILLPPCKIEKFPKDLTDPGLEYSGIYEDGWISEKSFFFLQGLESHNQLVIRGTVPLIEDPSFTSEIFVSLDGTEIIKKVLYPGDFDIHYFLYHFNKNKHKVDILFSRLQHLPNPDKRPVAAFIRYIGFDMR